ncbi:hypothetical protein ACH5RR_038433 [Cinchona calisaya]|uniref:Mitochondrial substrate carrier family protein n=1 Tax=Cinchona calisaya TaxID=153742 RepID=A0ABD2XYF6_9GENT
MAGGNKPPRSDKPSIKYRCTPLDGASFELFDCGREDFVSASTSNNKKSRSPEPRSSQILSTRELISALGSIWDFATGPLSSLVTKSTCKYGDVSVKKCNILCYPSGERTCSTHIVAGNQNDLVNFVSVGDSPPMYYANLRCLKVMDKISFIQPSTGTYSLLSRLLHGSYKMPLDSWKEKDSSNSGLECDLGNVYRWMTEIALSNPKSQLNCNGTKKQESVDCYLSRHISDPTACSSSVEKPIAATNLIMGNGECETDETQVTGSLSGPNDDPAKNTRSSTTVCTEDGLVQDIEACTFELPSLCLSADSLGSLVPSGVCVTEESETSVEPDQHETEKHHQHELVFEDNPEEEICLPMKEKSHSPVAKQEHAFAGAMAGVFVSLCLHPLDTVKTIVQSGRADQKSLHDICRSIIYQRGVTGLYRGISTNIASSAPISAVYTFTYESVKGILLPFLPKKYGSLAHCMAGGCASVATSFIFTPSERIKQQMQVGSRYQNCWNALVGIIEKGGLPSLYAGWGAVLCRNIPHSIIKFYTYESLKQLFSQVQLNGQTNTLVTVVCGGLAGSTAALFTTPFDVVKTRLQTQIPGSLNHCPGVFDTLQEIAKNEGLKGLFRGLTPRLFMYMTQGALFFASYESFKRLFSLDDSRVNVKASRREKNEEDHPPSYPHLDEDSIICLLVN